MPIKVELNYIQFLNVRCAKGLAKSYLKIIRQSSFESLNDETDESVQITFKVYLLCLVSITN